MRVFIAASSILASVIAAHATDSICEAVAKYTTEKPKTSLMPLNAARSIDAVTQYNVNKKTGVTSLCSHGGGCYPAEALRLTNCMVDKSKPTLKTVTSLLALIVIRSKVPPMFYDKTT